jgi:hypothetical protein
MCAFSPLMSRDDPVLLIDNSSIDAQRTLRTTIRSVIGSISYGFPQNDVAVAAGATSCTPPRIPLMHDLARSRPMFNHAGDADQWRPAGLAITIRASGAYALSRPAMTIRVLMSRRMPRS